MSADGFTDAYFGGRFSGVRDEPSVGARMLDGIADKVRVIAGISMGSLQVEVVQSLYARLRLRYWQGKNNSVDNHVGYALTPFSEHVFSVPAMWIPVSAKRDGWFERQLICRVSPTLAAYPSTYGYDFKTGPGVTKRLKDRVTCYVPTRIRARRRRSAIDFARTYYQTRRYIEARFGSAPLQVEQYFVMDELSDPLAFSRALTIERIWRGEWFLS
jgi:hypothetical protein